jgi:site-specific DNA-methyltransferase (adenine-specific)
MTGRAATGFGSRTTNAVLHGDCLDLLPTLAPDSIALMYLDPPFNTGTTQQRDRIAVTALNAAAAPADRPAGVRTGFGGRHYAASRIDSPAYADRFDDHTAFLLRRIEAALPALTADASIFVHLDWREVHYAKVALDQLLGREHFMNEIIWAYDYGGRSKTRWPAKHDTILWYVRNRKHYIFDFDAMDRIPYMAPGLVTREKAERGKTPTDVWWHTIVPTNGAEKTGYPTQKPLGVLRRIVAVHSRPGDIVLDPFAGSGTTGAAAAELGRSFVLIDESPDAVAVMRKRLAGHLGPSEGS